MRKIFIVIAIILMATGYAAGADYWHFGVGMRLTGVMPGNLYSNALGTGVLVTFGNPDSRFTTQFDLDSWRVKYSKDGDSILTSAINASTITYKIRQRRYSGLGVGIFEKYRALDFLNAFSTYLIGGFGGYFLTLNQEESDNGTVNMRSKGQHALAQIAGGLGLEGHFNQHVYAFVEGRFIGFINGQPNDQSITKGYLGVRYVF
jgi:hypothetical protein